MVTLGEEQKLFYPLLGQAVEHWSHIEDALCDVFLASIGIDLTDEGNRAVGAAAFYAVLSFEAKLSMTHATVCARFPVSHSILPALIAFIGSRFAIEPSKEVELGTSWRIIKLA
jgi:hypothetical protein